MELFGIWSFVAFRFVCKVTLDSKGDNVGRMGKVHKSGSAPYCWYSTVWRTDAMGIYYLKWGIGGRLWGAFQPPCVFDSLVNGFAVFTVLFCRTLAAYITAVLVVV